MSRAAAERLSRRVCWSAVALLALLFGLRAAAIAWPVARELWLIRASGYTALAALFAALCVTPLSRLAARVGLHLPAATWGAFRRSFGISAAGVASAHAGLVLATYLEDSWPALLDRPFLRAGLLALVILLGLLLTSFPRLIALLRVHLWKPLHRLAYVAALFLLQHLLLSPFAPTRLTVGLFAGLALVSLLRLLRPRVGRVA